MTSVQPPLGVDDVAVLLREEFGAGVRDLAPLGSGQISRTFAYAADDGEYVIRFNQENMAFVFDKEAYIATQLAPPDVPIPEIARLGRFRGYRYIIARRAPGQTLLELDPTAYAATIPSLCATLDAIHRTDLGDQPGYGVFDERGVGLWPSWRAHLANIRDEEPADLFYGAWHTLFETTFLERDVWHSIYARMRALLDVCPEERWLVHGGYGYGNVLARDGRVTAVLDWADARYGDFLYDIAVLDFWPTGHDFAAIFRERYSAADVAVPDYDRRLLCYTCYIGLDALRFFAKTGQEEAYRHTRDDVLARLGAAGV